MKKNQHFYTIKFLCKQLPSISLVPADGESFGESVINRMHNIIKSDYEIRAKVNDLVI